MLHFIRNFKIQVKSAGFSFVESLIGIILFSLAVVAIMTITSNISGHFNLEVQENTVFNTFTYVRDAINFENTCRLALGGPLTNNNTAIGISQTFNANGPASVKIFQPTGALDASAGGRPVYLDPNPASPQNTIGQFRITSAQVTPLVTPAPVPGTVPAVLNIQVNAVTLNGNRLSQNIYLTLIVDAAGKIVSCFPLTYNSDANPVQVCTNSQALTSLGPYVICKQFGCPMNQKPNGYDVNGNIICNNCTAGGAVCGGLLPPCCSGACLAGTCKCLFAGNPCNTNLDCCSRSCSSVGFGGFCF